MPDRNLLVGERVRLAAVQDDDLPHITRWYQDGAFMRLYDATPATPHTPKQVENLIREGQRSSTGFVFGIRRREDDALLGVADLSGILWAMGTTWVSIAIGDPAQRGQGYGSEALRLLLGFAFDELNLRRVQLTVFSYNARAVHVYERLGFRREGVFREFLVRDGAPHDMLLYGLLRREWQAAQTGDG